MDLDPGDRAGDRGNQARQHRDAGAAQRVCEPICQHGMNPRPGREDLERTDVPGRRIAAVRSGNVAPDLSDGARDQPQTKHRQSVAVGPHGPRNRIQLQAGSFYGAKKGVDT